MADTGYDPYNTSTRLPALSVEFTPEPRFTCTNCQEAPCFAGWDNCLECGVAITLVEDPDYIAFARRTYAHERDWLAKLEAEWNRQASAFVPCGAQVAA